MKRVSTRSIGDVIADYVRESSLEEGLLATRIYEAWDALTVGQVRLGECTSRHTFRDGVLTCRMRSSVVRAHLQFQTGALTDLLNARLGGDYVKQIKLI